MGTKSIRYLLCYENLGWGNLLAYPVEKAIIDWLVEGGNQRTFFLVSAVATRLHLCPKRQHVPVLTSLIYSNQSLDVDVPVPNVCPRQPITFTLSSKQSWHSIRNRLRDDMATQEQTEVNRQDAQESTEPRPHEGEARLSSNESRSNWPPPRTCISVSVPKTIPELCYPEERVLEAGFPPANDPEFVEALRKLGEARRLDTEYAQRVAIWLVLTGWQMKRAQQARDGLHQRMDEARGGISVAERDAIQAGCRRELIAWSEYEFRAKKEHVQALEAWQVLTGAKRPKRKKPDPEERIRHLLPYTPAFPPMRTRVDAWRESFIREALLLHFRTGAEKLARQGIHVPVFN